MKPPTFEEALQDAMPIADTSAVREAHARELTAAKLEGAREALQKVIAEDVHAMPISFGVPRHGPCHPSDGARMCAAHRVLTFDYPAEPLPPDPED